MKRVLNIAAAAWLVLGAAAYGEEPGDPPAPGDSPEAGSEAESTPPVLKDYLDRVYGRFSAPTIIAHDSGDLDGDGTDELVALYRFDFAVPPSEETRGKRVKKQQTVLAVFSDGGQGMGFEDDVRLPWCRKDTCRAVRILGKGHIEVLRRTENDDQDPVERTLKLRYADRRFVVAGESGTN